MFCSNCGKEIKDGVKFCPSCGAPNSAAEKIKAAATEAFDSTEKELGSAINEVEDSIRSAVNRDAGNGNRAGEVQGGNAAYTNTEAANSDAAYVNNGAGSAETTADNSAYGSTADGSGYADNAGAGDGNGNSNGNGGTVVGVGGGNGNANGNANGNGSVYGSPKERLKDDRGIASYIILSIITCGIYGYYFIYKMAHDVNLACDGDGENTTGLAMFIVLSFVTCGFYAYYWYYKLGNRLADNAPRYGLSFREDGTTVLLWCLFGLLVCGIGPFIGMYILIKNSNLICGAYNRQNGL